MCIRDRLRFLRKIISPFQLIFGGCLFQPENNTCMTSYLTSVFLEKFHLYSSHNSWMLIKIGSIIAARLAWLWYIQRFLILYTIFFLSYDILRDCSLAKETSQYRFWTAHKRDERYEKEGRKEKMKAKPFLGTMDSECSQSVSLWVAIGAASTTRVYYNSR